MHEMSKTWKSNENLKVMLPSWDLNLQSLDLQSGVLLTALRSLVVSNYFKIPSGIISLT